MEVHAAAATIPGRPTAYQDVYDPGPSAFPVTTCDAELPAGTSRAAIGDRSLPVPRATVRRLLLIGDTGCRMKARPPPEQGQYQDCDDPAYDGVGNYGAPYLINHQPFLAYNSGGSSHPGKPHPGVEELQGVLGWIYGELLVPGAVDMVMNGHVHEAQVTSYTTGQPPSFVLGNGGTNPIEAFTQPLDPPNPGPPGTLDAVAFMDSPTWGFATMERSGAGWVVTFHDQDGSVRNACSVAGRVLSCTNPTPPTPAPTLR